MATQPTISIKALIPELLQNNFIVVDGRLGSGKTLAVVAILMSAKPDNLVSNIVLNGIPYEKFYLHNLFEYKNRIIFIDMADIIVDNRTTYNDIHDNFIGFIDSLKENSNHLIITVRDRKRLDPDIHAYVDTYIHTVLGDDGDCIHMQIAKEKNITLSKITKIVRFYKSYDSQEMPIPIISRFRN